MVKEATLEQTDNGMVSTTPGWFVLNARDARWGHTPGMGYGLALTGVDDTELAYARFPPGRLTRCPPNLLPR